MPVNYNVAGHIKYLFYSGIGRRSNYLPRCHFGDVVLRLGGCIWIPPLVDSISLTSELFIVAYAQWGYYFSWLCTAGNRRRKSLSLRATIADGRDLVSTCCEPYGGGSVPELSNTAHNLQCSVSGVTRLIHQTNNSED